MVAEDAAHAAAARPFESMSPDEQTRELVFLLRDQDGGQLMQPGAPNIWSDDRGEQSPARRLAALGYAAVPALLAALDDPRFTRTVGFHRQFVFSHEVVTVGEAAFDVIERIAGRSFSPLGAYVDPAAVEAAKRWWQSVLDGGEEAELVSTYVEGGREAPSALRRLKERYPAAVADDQGPSSGVRAHRSQVIPAAVGAANPDAPATAHHAARRCAASTPTDSRRERS